MTLTDYFTLSIEERISLNNRKQNHKPEVTELTLDEYYKIEDACSFLEQLRAYQLADILGKYKLF